MARAKNLIGQRFGRLTVIAQTKCSKNGNARWLCKCDCGNTKDIASESLKRGHTKSCGCLCQEATKARAIIHGGRDTRLYRIWHNMKVRVNNPNAINYQGYGGRGIDLCQEWADRFEVFRDWAVANGYDEHLTIERIDNNKGYYPGNCRWATRLEQGANKRNNHVLSFDGQEKTISEWARIVNIDKRTILTRIALLGWTVERALTTPPLRGVSA